MATSVEPASARTSPSKSPSKLVRVISTPEYIPTLGGSDILIAKEAAAGPNGAVKKTSGWGRIRNVADIREALAPDDSENDTTAARRSSKRYGVEDFQRAAKLLLKSKKAIERVRERCSANRMRSLRGLPHQKSVASFENLDDYNLKKMHMHSRTRRQLKLAMLQKQFLDELPALRERSIREHLARKIEVLQRIKTSSYVLQDTKLLNELADDTGRPYSDQPTRRQSRMRRSIDINASPVKLLEEHKGVELSPSDVDQVLAVAKSREKIESQLDLPTDRVMRLTRLRQNVSKINVKFQNFLKDRKGVVEKDAGNDDDEKAHYAPSRFVKTGMALRLFRKYSRIVLIVLQWINMIMNKQFDFEKELKSFVDIANEIEDQTVSSTMHEMGLSFDKKFFKANREISLSSEARKILTTRWQSRTPQMIKQVMNGLHSLRSLSEYPIQTQEKLCRVAWYQTIGPKKLIIRQGHHAESFYFILSGAAFVKKMVQDPVTGENKAQVAARLTRGHSFGEIGLLFDTLRTATVESSTPMELLVIGKEDFVHIFMKAENPDDEADHIKFLRTISFMKYWPIDALKLEPGACLTHYFKRGTLITDNDKHSEWIYFILNGSCISLKKLKAVKPRSPNDVRPKSDPLATIILPELGMPSNCAKIDSGKMRGRHKSNINTEIFDEMTNYYESIRQYVPTPENLTDQYKQDPRAEKKGETTQADPTEEVFIKVESLHANDTFGLNTLKYVMDADDEIFDVGGDNESPILALVSRGAEVVMLSKKVFLKFADQKCRMHVREKIRVYPTETVMQTNMQLEADWGQYKTNIMEQCLQRKSARASKITT